MTKNWLIFLLWNLFVLLVYGFDKLRAKGGGRRVREAMLLTFCYLLGSVGALFGMVLFNHKTSKMKFRILVPLGVLLHLALLCAWLKYC